MAKRKFPEAVAVRWEDSDNADSYLLTLGDPAKPHLLDAGDGDHIAVYTLHETFTYRTDARLEKRRR